MSWLLFFCHAGCALQRRIQLLLRYALAVTLLLSLSLAQAEPVPAKRVLLLQSFAQGNAWPESINRGVRKGLANAAQPIELYIENADITGFGSKDYPALAEFIARKYALRPPDIVMAADERALDFLSRYRQQLFADKPLVFSTFPQLNQAQLAQLGNAYQVLDVQDVAGNFQLISEVLPKARTLVLIGDAATVTGRDGIAQAVEQARSQFAEVRDLRGIPYEQLEKLLPDLPANSAVFIAAWIVDEQGKLLDPFVVIPKIVNLLKVPSFAAFDVMFGFGVTGGKVSSGEWRGEAMAAMARQLLSGANAPLGRVREARQAVMFSYPSLQKLGLEDLPLPAESILLNKPKAFYESNPQAFFGMAAAIALLLVAIGSLIILLRVRLRGTEQLRDSEARYRLMFEQNPSPLLAFDPEKLTCLAINPAFTQAFGYSFADLLDLPMEALVAPSDREKVRDSIRQVEGKDPESAIKYSWKSVTKSGEVRDVETTGQRILFNDRPARVVLFSDVTERLLAEAAQKNSEARLNQIIESSPVAMIVLDAEQRVTHWNFAVERMTHIPASVMVGKRHHLGKAIGENWPILIESLLDGLTLAQMTELYGVPVRQSKFIADGVEADIYSSGVDCWTHSEVVPLRDAQGRLDGAIMATLDVSDVHRASQQLATLNAELEERVATRTGELSQAMNQLVQSEKLAALGSLVAGVAHELNTPLGNVMTVVTTLSDHLAALRTDIENNSLRRSQLGEFVQTCAEACSILERNTRRAGELVTSFKQVAVDQTSSRRRRFKLTDALQETLSTLTPLYKHKPVTVSTEVSDELQLDSFPGPLEQVITNLLSNAVTHALGEREHLHITILASATLWCGQPAMLLKVSDDGLGMSSDVIHRVFEPFFTTRLGLGGSGLGLYVVYNLVTALLGGHIELESEPGQGSSFVLHIPLTAPLSATEDMPVITH